MGLAHRDGSKAESADPYTSRCVGDYIPASEGNSRQRIKYLVAVATKSTRNTRID